MNFAYISKNGKPLGQPNPLQFDFIGSGEPRPPALLFGQDDKLTVKMHDAKLRIDVADHNHR